MAIRTDSQGLTHWVEVDLSALRHNLAEVRAFVDPSVKIMAVVKGNAYGHGTVIAGKAFVEAGADCLGVTTLEEALELRESGVECPVLAFAPLLPDQMRTAVQAGIVQTVSDLRLAEELSHVAQDAEVSARVHVKVDTGMGRLGLSGRDCLDFVRSLLDLAGIEIAGIYTHFADAGAADLSKTTKPLSAFRELVRELADHIGHRVTVHAANSAAVLRLPDAHLDMVRPGTVLYGQVPAPHLHGILDLRDTWALKTRVVALRKLPVGASVGYGGEFTAKRPTIAAVLPIGYSDGLTLIPESLARRQYGLTTRIKNCLSQRPSRTSVIVRGVVAPLIGRVSMQMCSVDVTDIPGVSVGDEVTLPARRTSTSGRIPRVYVG